MPEIRGKFVQDWALESVLEMVENALIRKVDGPGELADGWVDRALTFGMRDLLEGLDVSDIESLWDGFDRPVLEDFEGYPDELHMTGTPDDWDDGQLLDLATYRWVIAVIVPWLRGTPDFAAVVDEIVGG